ncbi:hypothetical protein, partial [Trinickia sp.]|uniref:hypothetical protein n=1 Tax=Trinickia sp. TaxID=2571163 RepID=UPI003F7E957B
RDEEHVIERECFLDQTHGKSYRRKSELYAIPPCFSLCEQQVSVFSGQRARSRFALRFEPCSRRFRFSAARVRGAGPKPQRKTQRKKGTPFDAASGMPTIAESNKTEGQ